MKFQVERTEKIFDEGKKLIELTANDTKLKKLSKELKLTWLGGMKILDKIKENNYDVFNKRPKISNTDKLKIFIKSR
jgi:phytoene/squalene synthetase